MLDQVRVQSRDLFLGDLDLLEGGRDLLEGQVAALAAKADQTPQLLDLQDRAVCGIAIHDVGHRLQRFDGHPLCCTLSPNSP